MTLAASASRRAVSTVLGHTFDTFTMDVNDCAGLDLVIWAEDSWAVLQTKAVENTQLIQGLDTTLKRQRRYVHTQRERFFSLSNGISYGFQCRYSCRPIARFE